MKSIRYIKQFVFDDASYYVSDGLGSEVLLKINYKDNTYVIENKGGRMRGVFKREVGEVAIGLLQRKHGVNRAGSLRG